MIYTNVLTYKGTNIMDTCDRYELHEMYKDKVKTMISAFTIELFEQLEKTLEQGDHFEDFDIPFYIDEWVEKYIRPAFFEEE
jgi:hypothetical protein